MCRAWPSTRGQAIEAAVASLLLEDEVASDSPHPSYSGALAEKTLELFAELAELLTDVCGRDMRSSAHAARIACKRLRYLLEPTKGASPAVRLVAERSKALQDLLGELQDITVLRQRLAEIVSHDDARQETAGIVEIGRRAEARAEVLFAELHRDYGDPEPLARFERQVHELANQLGELGSRQGADSAAINGGDEG
jgi:CHAD domain-containing protein